MTLQQLKENWQNTPEYHAHLKALFTQLVNEDTELIAHRKWVREHVFGMGEDAFHWFWKLVVDELPQDFKFIEIGCHKGQVLSLIRLLSNRANKDASIFGITPMNGAGTGWTEDDYQGDIKKLHDEFKLQYPVLYKGFSQEKEARYFAVKQAPFDVVYIDGDHSYDGVMADLDNYAPLVKKDGFLVMDDCCCDLNFAPSGHFTGIKEVTDAFTDYMKGEGEKWEFMFNVEHLRLLRRK
jgi:hypothetical protein